MSSPEEEISKHMQQLAAGLGDTIEAIAGEKLGFSLIVFNKTPGSRMSYVSNCDRDEVISAMKSLLKGWEGGMPDIPLHKVQ